MRMAEVCLCVCTVTFKDAVDLQLKLFLEMMLLVISKPKGSKFCSGEIMTVVH